MTIHPDLYSKLHSKRMIAIERAISSVKHANMIYQSKKLQAALETLYEERAQAVADFRHIEACNAKVKDTHTLIFRGHE